MNIFRIYDTKLFVPRHEYMRYHENMGSLRVYAKEEKYIKQPQLKTPN